MGRPIAAVNGSNPWSPRSTNHAGPTVEPPTVTSGTRISAEAPRNAGPARSITRHSGCAARHRSYTEVLTVPQVFVNNFMVARMSAVATQDLFEWTIDSMKDGDLGLSVTNLLGEEVYADEVMLTAGLNDLSVDLSANPEGIYKVAMTMEDETETLVVKRVTAEILKKTNVASSKRVNPGRN